MKPRRFWLFAIAAGLLASALAAMGLAIYDMGSL